MNELQVVMSSWLTPTVLFCILNLTIATIFILNPPRKYQQKHELIRVTSLFERVKSFNLSMHRPDPVHNTMAQEAQQDQPIDIISHVTTEKVIEKTTSFSGEDDDDEAVDAKADDFINKFRQQLKLQRLDSILRYKEMLKRGS